MLEPDKLVDFKFLFYVKLLNNLGGRVYRCKMASWTKFFEKLGTINCIPFN